MAFVIPTFNLVCDVFTFPYNFAGAPRIANQICQLRAPSVQAQNLGNGLLAITQTICLIVPKGTDIRDQYCTPINSSDAIVLPPGTGCRYQVLWVNDIGRGFPNEHRYATLAKINSGPWPTPIPPG
jgi:hypothetical protein